MPTVTEPIEQLQAAIALLSSFRTIQCTQEHEEVVEVSQGKSYNAEFPYLHFKLKGFCQREFRNTMLGCSHNTVLSRYILTVSRLEDSGAIGVGELPIDELTAVVTAIYFMDHERSQREKRLAAARFLQPDAPATVILPLEKAISEIKADHVALLVRLNGVHQQLLTLLRKRLEEMRERT